jgi:dipeptidyl aminopeptidase/acylaminoacyl peptidase
MKQVDYEHFGRFLCPHTLTSRGDDLYFCVKRTDFEENKYRSDLFLLRDGKPRQLTASGDVGEYHLLDSGVVFASLREKKDRETVEKGVPLTVLQRLPYDGGEAEPFLRLPYNVTGLWFLNEQDFFFTASCSRTFEAALDQCGGDAEKAAETVKADEDYRVLDEIPFVANGEGYINGIRNRLFRWRAGTVTAVTEKNAAVNVLALSEDGKTLWYAARTFTGCDPFCDRLYQLDTRTMQADDITVCDTANHTGVWQMADGALAVQAIVGETHGINENAKVFLRENGAYRKTYGAGEHDFYGALGSDVSCGRAMSSAPLLQDEKIILLDTQDDSVQVIALDPRQGTVTNISRTRGNITDVAGWRGGYAIIAMRGNGGSEIYALDGDGRETRLTDLNTALCAEYAYSAPQPIALKNSRGVALHGWAIPPVDAEPGKKYPTILDVHGGPKTAYGDSYFHEMQLWANRGFAVIFCNPTGSDGRGDDFADIFGAYGDQDYKDIMDFTDEAVRRCGFIDPAHMGVTGGSYGGFMTNWIIGHTHRFRAAASQRSIANWTGFYGTSDIGYFFQPDQTGADPWQDVAKIWAQSPLKYADQVQTPTLFIHSDEDFRCPLPEGLQMFTALRAHGVEARLCMFKGENHELSRSGKPKHRVRRLKEITEWFEKYLKA